MLTNAYLSLSKHEESLFLYEIPKAAITKIFLGCCINDKKKKSIISKIKTYNSSIEIIASSRHKSRFELNFDPIAQA